jgi:hypothetical protein
MGLPKYRALWVGIGVSAVSLVLFFIIAGFELWTEPSACIAAGNCYCEEIRWDALVKQPVNTWSNLIYVAFGLLILWHIDAHPVPDAGDETHAFHKMSGYGFAYGLVTISIGFGSFYFHGTLTAVGNWLDLMAMYAFILFVPIYTLSRVFGWGPRLFTGTYVGILVLTAVLGIYPFVARIAFGTFVTLAFLTEITIAVVGKQQQRPGARRLARMHVVERRFAYVIWAVIFFLGAYAIWLPSRTGRVLCDPASFWQGHALWHFLNAASTWFLYLYFRSERISPQVP